MQQTLATKAITANSALTDQEIDLRLTTRQKRHMRLCNFFHEAAFAVKDDLITHPWKFLFYATPIPPGASTILLLGTLAYIAIGRTERLKQYRKNMNQSLKAPIDYDRYRTFLSHDVNDIANDDKASPSPLKIEWGKFANERWFQTRRYLLENAVEWTNTTSDSRFNRSFRKTLAWDINRMKKGSHGHLFHDLPAIKPH